jgi:predicted DNA-binding protein (MmcQ/YjbR family)
MTQAGPKTERMRKIALALPEATEEVTWGTDVNFRVRKKIFLFPGEEQMTVKTDPDEREALLATGRFHVAAYVGRFGWLTMDIPKRPTKADWEEIGELIATSYCLIAPKKLAATVRPG